MPRGQVPIGGVHNGGGNSSASVPEYPTYREHALAQQAEHRPETVVTGNREFQPKRLCIKGLLGSHRRPVFYSEIRSNKARARSQSVAIWRRSASASANVSSERRRSMNRK